MKDFQQKLVAAWTDLAHVAGLLRAHGGTFALAMARYGAAAPDQAPIPAPRLPAFLEARILASLQN